MGAAYDDWSKARVQEELRSRSLPDAGSSKALRERLREDDRARSRENGADGDAGERASGNGGRRADGEKRASSDSGEKRASSDSGEKRASSDSGGGRTRSNGDQRTRAKGQSARAGGGKPAPAPDGGQGGDGDRRPRPSSSGQGGDAATQQRSERAPTRDVIARAVREIAAITGRQPTDVVGLRRADAGWRLTVEALDSARVPSSGDLLSAYEAVVDRDGHVRSVERTSRYTRQPAVRRPRLR